MIVLTRAVELLLKENVEFPFGKLGACGIEARGLVSKTLKIYATLSARRREMGIKGIPPVPLWPPMPPLA